MVAARANEDLYGMLNLGRGAVVIIYCETNNPCDSVVLHFGLRLGLSKTQNSSHHTDTHAESNVRKQRCQ